MGTRSLTTFLDEGDEEICVMYRQFNGHPEGHGRDLAEFIQGKKLVNGITVGVDDKSSSFNGMRCLAASVIAEFKNSIGGIYVHRAGSRDIGEKYIYTILGETGELPKISLSDTYDGGEKLFEGNADEFIEWIRKRG